jgi:alpha-glucoside transport system permease protein
MTAIIGEASVQDIPKPSPLKARKPSAGGRLAGRLGTGLISAAVLLVGMLWVVPTFGLLVESFRSQTDNSATGWWNAIAHPSQLTAGNYANLFKNGDMIQSLWNTVLITVPATVLVVVIGALAAYALAWIDFKGRDWVFIVVVALIIVPIQLAIIPDAKIYSALGIYGSVTCVVLFHVAFGLPFAVFLLRNFYLQIPQELFDAARVDGAGDLTVFRRVVLPIGWPAIASLAIYQFMWVWNDLLVALVFASPSHAPITYALYSQMRTFSTNIDIIGPGAFLSMIVPLGVFFAFQRYFVQGVLAGSVK